MFENSKESLFNGKIILRSQQRFRSDRVYIEEINKIALSSDDDKRLQTYNKIITYPYRTPAIKVCESEMLSKNKLIRLDDDKNMLKDETKDMDMTIPKTKIKDKDKDKDIPKIKTKTNTEYIDENKNKNNNMNKDIPLYYYKKTRNKKNGD